MVSRRILLATGVLGLGLLLSSQGSGQKKREIFTESPSCSDVIQIFAWSQKNHGLNESASSRPAFAKNVALLFSEKLDPNYILFTKSEVQELSQQVSKNWESFIHQKDCGVFSSWFNRTFDLAKKRLASKASHGLKTSSSKHSVKYHSFSSSLKELNDRQNALLENSSLSNIDDFFPEPVDAETTLAKALLGSLDPYSTYFSESEFSDFYEELSGRTAGVGITVEKSRQGLLITEVTSKSPADLAGIKCGDQIIEADGKSLSNLSFQQATQLLKGEDQTKIQLVLNSGSGRILKTLTRTTQVFEDKKVSTIKIKKQPGKKIALISIPSFYGRGGLGAEDQKERSSSEDLRTQLEKLQGDGDLNALILDLRGNPGGYLEEAVTIAGFFLGSKPVVGVKDREELRTLKSDWTLDPIYRGPLIVWVDRETASAGEILAAALKDHQRAILVGSSRTFGKGSVQKLIRLNDPFLNLSLEKNRGVVKLTTSVFFSPLGHSPANGGVKTDVLLKDKSNESRDKDPKPGSLKIKDVEPLIDANQLKELQEKENNFQDLVAHIQEQEQEQGSAKTAMNQVFEIANQVVEINSL